MATGFQVIDESVAAKLVCLLAVFSSPLALALASETTVTAMRLAYLPQGQGQVDKGQNVIYSLGLLLYPPRAVSTIAVLADPSIWAACSSWDSGTPVMRSTRSSQ